MTSDPWPSPTKPFYYTMLPILFVGALVEIHRVNMAVGGPVKEEIAGQPLKNVAVGGPKQAAENGTPGIEFLKAAPDSPFALLRGHMPGVEVARHAEITLGFQMRTSI